MAASSPASWQEAGRLAGRALDLLIAAAGLAEGLPFYTRNPDDFEDLDGFVEIRAVP